MPMIIHPDPAKVLVETGLLFRLNREILHPHGLALVLEEGEGGSRITGVWVVDDPDGIIFDEEGLVDGQAKHDAFMRTRGEVQLAARRATLGYVVQPLPAQAQEEGAVPVVIDRKMERRRKRRGWRDHPAIWVLIVLAPLLLVLLVVVIGGLGSGR